MWECRENPLHCAFPSSWEASLQSSRKTRSAPSLLLELDLPGYAVTTQLVFYLNARFAKASARMGARFAPPEGTTDRCATSKSMIRVKTLVAVAASAFERRGPREASIALATQFPITDPATWRSTGTRTNHRPAPTGPPSHRRATQALPDLVALRVPQDLKAPQVETAPPTAQPSPSLTRKEFNSAPAAVFLPGSTLLQGNT